MSGKAPFNGKHQKAALADLVKYVDGALYTRSGKPLDEVAETLRMSRSNLDRYRSGDIPLGSDQFGAFAEAFETTKDELLRACFPVLKASGTPARAPEPTLRELLEAEGLPDDEIRQLESSIGNAPTTLEFRQGMALMARAVMRKRRAEEGQKRRRA